jgi:hypothetical protein
MNETLQREPVLATIAESSSPVVVVESATSAAETVVSPALEQRIQALEQSVDELKNSPILEERITTRVLERLPRKLDGPRWYNRLNPFRGKSIPMPSGWVLVDLVNEARFTIAMLIDRRYAMTWTSRGIVAGAIVIAFTASLWLSPFVLVPFIGTTIQSVLDKLLILLCGGLIFKILHREAERYRKFLENLSS